MRTYAEVHHEIKVIEGVKVLIARFDSTESKYTLPAGYTLYAQKHLETYGYYPLANTPKNDKKEAQTWEDYKKLDETSVLEILVDLVQNNNKMNQKKQLVNIGKNAPSQQKEAFDITQISHQFSGYRLNKEARLLDWEFQSSSANYPSFSLKSRNWLPLIKEFWSSFVHEYKRNPECWDIKKQELITTQTAEELHACIKALIEEHEIRKKAKTQSLASPKSKGSSLLR